MSFLKNIEHSRYNLDDIIFKTFICKDCSKENKNKEYELCNDSVCVKDLKNYGYVALNYLQNPIIYITTPPMVCLFGVSKDNWNMSLQFKNFKTDHVMKNFFNFIQEMEFKIMEYLGLDENDSDLFVSQIRYDKKINMILI